jgi:hypothetical protein
MSQEFDYDSNSKIVFTLTCALKILNVIASHCEMMPFVFVTAFVLDVLFNICNNNSPFSTCSTVLH